MRKIWDTHLKPYLLRQDCFRRRSRLKTWLKINNEAIQVCSIELDLTEQKEECAQVKALTYLYLNDFKKAPADWQDKRIYFQPTATVLDLERFSSFDEYASAVSKSSRGNDNRSVKRAQRLGYETRIIDPTTYQASIDRIRRSKLIRTGGLMADAFRRRTALIDSDERAVKVPSCTKHWTVSWGAFKEGQLLAYASLMRCGNIVRTIDIMGHRDALKSGALKLLLFDIIRSLLEDESAIFQGIRYFIYGALEHGREGLSEWKERLQFHPSLLDMRLVFADLLPADFDEPSYLGLNPDVKRAKLDGRLHYAVWGKREGRRYN